MFKMELSSIIVSGMVIEWKLTFLHAYSHLDFVVHAKHEITFIFLTQIN